MRDQVDGSVWDRLVVRGCFGRRGSVCPRSSRSSFAFALSYLPLRSRLRPRWWRDPPETQSPAVRVVKRALSLPLVHPRPRVRLQTLCILFIPVILHRSPGNTRLPRSVKPDSPASDSDWSPPARSLGDRVLTWGSESMGSRPRRAAVCSAIRLRRRNRAQGPRCLRGGSLICLGGCVSHNTLYVQPARRPQRKAQRPTVGSVRHRRRLHMQSILLCSPDIHTRMPIARHVA
jgi:hypothetical protein